MTFSLRTCYRLVTGALNRLSRNVRFVGDYQRFRRLAVNGPERFSITWRDRYPCLDDKTPKTAFDRHYLYHPAWAARIVATISPERHVDISSILHFAALVSAFVPVDYYDYRPADVTLKGLSSYHADLYALPFADKSIESLSCMHVVEHIGLGRYGDPIDPNGDLAAIAELKRVIAVNGTLLLVVPVGRPRIMFNAHRIYAFGQIMEYFSDLELVEFSLVPDDAGLGGLIMNATREQADAQEYGCGCFWFRR